MCSDFETWGLASRRNTRGQKSDVLLWWRDKRGTMDMSVMKGIRKAAWTVKVGRRGGAKGCLKSLRRHSNDGVPAGVPDGVYTRRRHPGAEIHPRAWVKKKKKMSILFGTVKKVTVVVLFRVNQAKVEKVCKLHKITFHVFHVHPSIQRRV